MLEGPGMGTRASTRTLSERVWTSILPRHPATETGPTSSEPLRRARLLVGVLALCALNVVFTATVHTILGNYSFAGTFVALLAVVAALVWAVRAGLSLDLAGHATVAGILSVSLWVALSTGGKVAGGLFFLVLVPATATLVVGRRAGVGWAGVTLAVLIAIGLFSGPGGLEPWVELDMAETSAANLRAAGLVLLAVTGIAYFFSLLQDRARNDLERLLLAHRDGERRFRAITERAGDLIAELDAKGRFIFASPGFEEDLGWKPEALIGTAPWRSLHPDDRRAAAAAWRVLLEKGSVRQQPVRLLSSSQEWKWFEISMRSYLTATNETRVVSVARNVTERHEREAQLRRQHRLATGGIMAAGAAHQLATPLTSILASAQLARRTLGDADLQHVAVESLESVEEEARRSSRILKSMLAFARDEVAERWVEDLKLVLAHALRAVQPEIRAAGVELVKSVTRREVRARVSPIEIEQVVVNLIRNSMQAGARLIVLGLDVESESIARITVSDDGPGLGRVDVADAFRAFFSGREGEGVGLGLTVAREIVVAHGGEITISRSGADGTVVRVDLPLYRVEH